MSNGTRYGLFLGSDRPVKAWLWNEDKGQKIVECLFNPQSYTITRSNTWGGDVSRRTFQSSEPMSLDINGLMFDTYTRARSGDAPVDVRTFTDKLFKLMNIEPSTVDTSNGTTGRPPRVTFRWGSFCSFKAIVKTVSQEFTLFWDDGRPVRAKVNVKLEQADAADGPPPQNPTSMGAPLRVRVVGPSETIDGIAFGEYGDASKWRVIADYNRLTDPLRLRAGQRLVIPLER